MSLSRRGLLAGLGAAALAPTARAQAIEPGRSSLSVSARPLSVFEPGNPTKTRFGQLVFRSGLVLSAGHPRFGGFSGRHATGGGERQGLLADGTARAA
jgi:hypothetical protein